MTNNPILRDGIANGTISKGQLVKYASGGWVACSTLGERADGIAFEDATAGDAFSVQIGGLVEYKVGAAGIADGDALTADANGLGITAVATNVVRLKAKGAASAGAYAQAYWADGYTA